jgi:SAM-dependent methyltransferase
LRVEGDYEEQDGAGVIDVETLGALKDYYKRSEAYRQHLVAKDEIYFSRYVGLVCSMTGPSDLILDVGCGSGTSARLIAGRGRRVVGTDISSLFLSAGRGNGCAADAAQLPFRRETFDVVGAMEFIEHVWPVGAVLREMARVVRTSGKIVITSPNLLSPLWPLRDLPGMLLHGRFRPPHYRNFPEASRYFLSSAAASVQKWSSRQPRFLPRRPELSLADGGGDFDAVYLAHPRDIILYLRGLGFSVSYAKMPSPSARTRAATLLGGLWGSFILVASKTTNAQRLLSTQDVSS